MTTENTFKMNTKMIAVGFKFSDIQSRADGSHGSYGNYGIVDMVCNYVIGAWGFIYVNDSFFCKTYAYYVLGNKVKYKVTRALKP